MLHPNNVLFLSHILKQLINMKGIIVFRGGQVYVGSLKGFWGGWMGSEKSFRRKDWETHTENWTTPNKLELCNVLLTTIFYLIQSNQHHFCCIAKSLWIHGLLCNLVKIQQTWSIYSHLCRISPRSSVKKKSQPGNGVKVTVRGIVESYKNVHCCSFWVDPTSPINADFLEVRFL